MNDFEMGVLGPPQTTRFGVRLAEGIRFIGLRLFVGNLPAGSYSTYPPLITPPQEIRPYAGLINHWFPLTRPAINPLVLGGYVGVPG